MKYFLNRILWLCILIGAGCHTSYSQYALSKNIWDTLMQTESDASLSTEEKSKQLIDLKQHFEKLNLPKDSVYARLIHRIGSYEYALNDNIPTFNAIDLTQLAASINGSGKKGSSKIFLVNSYTNLGVYYKKLGLYNEAALYFDSALIARNKFTTHQVVSLTLMMEKASMLMETGDFQKAIDQLTAAILEAKRIKNDTLISSLHNQKAQANLKQGFLTEALKDVDAATDLAKKNKNEWELINTMVIRADIFAKQKKNTLVLPLYKKAIQQRIKTNDFNQISDDYTDLGNYFLYGLYNFPEAKKCYLQTLTYASRSRNAERLAKGHANLGITSFEQHRYLDAENYYSEAFIDLKLGKEKNIFTNPPSAELNKIGNKELILVILGNKTELLQEEYKNTKDKRFLTACLQTALLTDTLITTIRNGQVGEKSKLYWREWTREFFTTAIEACFIANDLKLAFFFMEKSRAVLLNDNLNEISAAARLPLQEAITERQLKISLLAAREKMAALADNAEEYESQQAKVLQAQDSLDHFIKSLEKKYPGYYQNKYSDKGISLHELQVYLSQQRQSFVHYFMNDTTVYMLKITADSARMIKLGKKDFNYQQITSFNNYCSNKQLLINDYKSFGFVANSLAKALIDPLYLTKGRVIICPDNFMLPFEALCSDPEGKNFMVNDYIFSYVYSARYLFNKIDPAPADGAFIGFAPVSFQSYLNVTDLKQSANFLERSGHYYRDKKILTFNQSSKSNFINYLGKYVVINIFSHARADTSGTEPVLYMQDSLIRLSELQVLNRNSTNLVMLSACQTNIGKNATGEGVYSLARGFATVGIPSVAATLWEADEQSIYILSELFNQYLSEGMSKDDALQQSKLSFLKRNISNEKSLPFYWAGMLIIGDTKPVKLALDAPGWTKELIAGGFVLVVVIIVIWIRKRRYFS